MTPSALSLASAIMFKNGPLAPPQEEGLLPRLRYIGSGYADRGQKNQGRFANSYRRFIQSSSKMAGPLTSMLKNEPNRNIKELATVSRGG